MAGLDFVRSGVHKGQFYEKACEWYGPVLLFDVDESEHVGAQYADKSRQLQPLAWHGTAVRKALDEHRQSRRHRRPHLKREHHKEVRPRLRKHAHPRPKLSRG